MMKKVWISLALVFSMALVNGGYAEVKPMVIRIAEHSPPKGVRGDGIRWMIERVEKQSGGKIKFDVYWGGSLLKASELIRGIGKGTADIAFIWPGYTPKELPVWQALNAVVIGPKDSVKSTELMLKLAEEIPAFREDFAKWNLKILGFHTTSSYGLLLVSPLNRIHDLKGRKVRAPDPSHLTMLKVMGSTPLFMPMGEVYTAIERRAIDGVFAPLESAYRFKFHEVAKHIYPCFLIWGNIPNVAAINVDTWSKIPKELHQMMEAVFREMSMYIGESIQNGYTTMREDFKKIGATANDIPDADLLKWGEMPEVKALEGEWVEKAKNSGLPGDEIMKRVKELIADATK